MASEFFELKPLEDLVSIHDADRSPVKKSDRKEGIYPYYGASGITDYVDDFIFDGDYVLLSEDGDNLRTRNTPIAFMARGKFWVNNHAHILKGKNGNNTDIICYALQVADVNSYISGSTRPKITQRDMKNIPVYCPPLKEQKAIAHILGSLDDKIELNRQMNETLEAMAQALFKSWFVDFDPVIDNALAAGNAIPDEFAERSEQRKAIEKKYNSGIQKLFPDEFEFTEEMGWIPKGWEVRKLKSICRVLNGRAYKNTEFKEQGTPIVRIQNLSRSGKTVYSDLDLPEDKIICTEDFLYAWSATFGPHIWRGPKSIYHYHIWKMDVDENIVSRYFLYLAMFRKTESMKNAGTGSIFTHLTKKIMEGQDILIGDEKVNTAFSNQVTVIFKKITKLDEENNSLSKIRDTLLPKLMSGELRIPDAAALVDKAI